MDNINAKLQSFENDKLIDIVKNYRQYGYGNDIRNTAVEILESRGISKNMLNLRDEFINKSYDEAQSAFASFERFSKTAFLLYALMLVFRIIIPVTANSGTTLQLLLVIAFWITLLLYFIFLIKSFNSQSKYYTLIEKKESQLNSGLYFTVGAAFYIIMYFVFRKQMKEDINLIR